jgi:hypothetical protein
MAPMSVIALVNCGEITIPSRNRPDNTGRLIYPVRFHLKDSIHWMPPSSVNCD